RRSGGVYLPRGRGGAVNEVRALLIAAAQSKPAGGGQDAANALIALVAIFVATKLLGEIAQRFRQPTVLGELIAGVLLGGSVLGAAVIDDIIGLIILAVVAAVVAGAALSIGSISRIAGVAVAFVALAVILGSLIAPPVFRVVERIRAAGALGLFGIAFAFLMAWLAQYFGSAMIVGAFAAGLVLFKLPQRQEIERSTTMVGHFLVPIFFASVGAAVNLRAVADPQALMVGAALVACGIVGKLLAGFAPWWFRGNKLLVGVGMVPRGEVGLIFAQMGLAAGAVSAGEYGALMLMVLVTTFVTPPGLVWVSRRSPGHRS